MQTLITNIKAGQTSKATTQRKNFPFTSFAKVGESVYAVSPEGLYKLGGDTDAGEEIGCLVRTPTSYIGSFSDKRLRYMYLGVETTGEILVTVENSNSSREYTFNATLGTGMQILNRAMDRDERGTWFNVTVENTNGAKFRLSHIEVLPILLATRIRS